MLLDLSLVTQALASLILKYAQQSPLKANYAAPPLVVDAQPADKLKGDNVIGLYLYHVKEDAQYKNQPAPYSDEPPVRFTPMGLDLHYQLSPHSDILGAPGTLREQLLLGVAIKALHDYPIVDDTTQIAGVKVFPVAIQNTDNRFRLVLEPITHQEAPNFWTGGNQPLRLAVYYQISVVLLEPEEPKQRSGRVLRYGVFSFVRSGPRLDGSRSTVTFTLPGEATPREAEASPAEAPIGGRLAFFGSDLSGQQTTLLLKNRRFSDAVEVGDDWGLVASEDEIFVQVQPTAGGFDILPGGYSAVAKVTERRTMPDGTLRDFPKTSNETPFLVTPAVDSIVFQPGPKAYRIVGGIFKHADLPPDAVEVYVASSRIPLKAAAALQPGEFEVQSAQALRLRFPIAGTVTGQMAPLRLIVNGAESAPKWVAVP
jgi:hypothetical protein